MNLIERDAFMRSYRKLLNCVFDDIYAEVRNYTDRINTGITCREGCGTCCSQFVSVNVSHAILITDYLYADKKAMAVFLSGYDRWSSSIANNPDAASILRQLEAHTSFAATLKPYPQELCVSYHKLGIPCPFLNQGQCSIRKVRPIVCAAYFSISPIVHCAPDSSVQPLILEVKPEQMHLKLMAELADSKYYSHQEPLPKIVNKMITQGLAQVEEEVDRLFGEANSLL